jgi:hypothetical protein
VTGYGTNPSLSCRSGDWVALGFSPVDVDQAERSAKFLHMGGARHGDD